LRTGVI